MLNQKRVRDVLASLKDNATLVKDFGTMIGFAGLVATSGATNSFALAAAIVSTAGAATSAGSRILSFFVRDDKDRAHPIESPVEKFDVLFYTLCMTSYLDALQHSSLMRKLKERENTRQLTSDALEQFSKRLSDASQQIEEADVHYRFCVDPASGPMPLFDAFSKWVSQAVAHFLPEHTWDEDLHKVTKDARHRLYATLSGDGTQYVWMRNFLALSTQTATLESLQQHKVSTDTQLQSILSTLEGWTATPNEILQRTVNRWPKYREFLRGLPDQKESMYNEEFGVRKVYVPPRANYHTVGTSSYNDKADVIEDVGRLLSALVSNRTTGDDLIFICGGPGSGKSTLCRILAAEFARRDDMHPVFLKLRRAKDRDQPALFVEESMIRDGLISRLSDIQDVPNLILILDGFDELVMASKTGLHHFFSVLQDDLRTGHLRSARIIVSGRDTLFPRGQGLPRGSHVVNVLPFDRPRIEAWGEKWRDLTGDSQKDGFRPETLLDSKDFRDLVCWPLTLHLLARLHTSGLFEVKTTGGSSIEKAYLYRGILHETTRRQQGQVPSLSVGEGRLDSDKMREFLRGIAWTMYVRGVDSLEIEDILPLAKDFFKGGDDVALAGLAEIAVVNSPEIQRGEESGFEFVHKSFSEFLVAEKLARDIESISYRVQEIDGTMAWRKDSVAAASLMWTCFAHRLLPAEVQEMLEPMLGVFFSFAKGVKVSDIVDEERRRTELGHVADRYSELYQSFVARGVWNGGHYPGGTAQGQHANSHTYRDAEANYGAAIVLIGAAACRRLRSFKINRSFLLEPFDGACWKWIMILHVGGVMVDQNLARRLYSGCTVGSASRISQSGEFSIPIQILYMHEVQDFSSPLSVALDELERAVFDMVDRIAVVALLQAELRRSGVASQEVEPAILIGHEDPTLSVRKEFVSPERRRVRSWERENLREEPDADRVRHFLQHALENLTRAFAGFYEALESGGLNARLFHGASPVRLGGHDRTAMYSDTVIQRSSVDLRGLQRLYESLMSSLCAREEAPWGTLPAPWIGGNGDPANRRVWSSDAPLASRRRKRKK